MTGWDLAATAETAIGNFWSLTRSHVYLELATMAEAGLVDAQPAGPRDRRPYRLTDAGREAFAAWIDREPGPENIRFPLLLTIEFGRHLEPERLAAFVHAHRADHARCLARYEAMQHAAHAAHGRPGRALCAGHIALRHRLTSAQRWPGSTSPRPRSAGPARGGTRASGAKIA